MTTNIRLSRFDNDALGIIESSGSVINPNLIENGVLRTNIYSTNPNKSLASFVVKYHEYSNEKISQLFSSEFTEFVNPPETASPAQDAGSQDQIQFLESRLQQLTQQLETIEEQQSLSTEQKNLIIDLRISLGQGISPEDFSAEFPYNRIIEASSSIQSLLPVARNINTFTSLIFPTNFNGTAEFIGPIQYDENNNIIPDSKSTSASDSVLPTGKSRYSK